MGPLEGIRVIELRGIGPAPFCGMLLADMGADVVVVDRARGRSSTLPHETDVLARGKRSVAIDLKGLQGAAALLDLVSAADILLEPYRPGVAERLGIGPDECHAVNPRLVYGRMTGYGQDGPYAQAPGHDINYIAINGVLSACGRAGGPPSPPVNLLGDYGGGGMLLACGVLAALHHARASGRGQVVDAAMTDGSLLLTALIHQMRAIGRWGERGTNIIDGGAPFYDVYRAADGWVTVGAIEPAFYAELIDVLGLDGDEAMHRAHHDEDLWPYARERFAELFATRTRGAWVEAFRDRDACFAPVWDFAESESEPQLVARDVWVHEFGVTQPHPAPRFSTTPTRIAGPPPRPGEHDDDVRRDWMPPTHDSTP